jgi:hypothetical protein
MAITLRVQDDNGTVLNANSYTDEQFFKDYFEEQGDEEAVTAEDETIKAALVRAKRFMDSRWNFKGEMVVSDASSAFPRYDLTDAAGNIVLGVPLQAKWAQCEYARLTLDGTPLNPTPTRDASGARVVQTSERVGPISESKTFASGGVYEPPEWPVPDSILKKAGFVMMGGTLVRG